MWVDSLLAISTAPDKASDEGCTNDRQLILLDNTATDTAGGDKDTMQLCIASSQ